MSAPPPPAVAESPTRSWTCVRCVMTVRWMPGSELPDLPAHWSEEDGALHCLACRRELAVERALEAAADQSGEARAKLRTTALVEFELRRDSDRNNGVIAKACRSSVPAVVKARQRLG